MKHFWFGAGLLGILLVLSLWVGDTMDRVHMPIADALEQAAHQALTDEPASGFATGRQAYAQWQRFRKGTASVADHTPMEEIDSLFCRMEVCIRAGETHAFAVCCTQLSALVRAAGESHTLSWWNLL